MLITSKQAGGQHSWRGCCDGGCPCPCSWHRCAHPPSREGKKQRKSNPNKQKSPSSCSLQQERAEFVRGKLLEDGAELRAATKMLRRGKKRERALETWLRAQPVQRGGPRSELMCCRLRSFCWVHMNERQPLKPCRGCWGCFISGSQVVSKFCFLPPRRWSNAPGSFLLGWKSPSAFLGDYRDGYCYRRGV